MARSSLRFSNRNVTIPPTSMTPAVEKPQISHVISVKTGQSHDSVKLITSIRYDRWMRLRQENLIAIRRGGKRVICQICHVPVLFTLSTCKRAFFKHVREDGSCPSITRSGISHNRLREMIYCGRQESKRHQETKNFIAESLEVDANFSNVLIEKTWKAKDGLSRRRPDVSAIGKNAIRFAFEAQLTTTFLDVVVGRREFYLQEGSLLVWVLREFDPSYRRATEDDILFSNNSNIIVVDQSTVAASHAAKQFMVRVHHRTIAKSKDHEWATEIVPFSSLTFDLIRQRTFFFDFETAESKASQISHKEMVDTTNADLDNAASIAETDERELEREELRTSILQFFEDRDKLDKATWKYLSSRLYRVGVPTSGRAADPWSVFRTVNALASAQQGRVIGYGLANLIAIANFLHEKERSSLRAFLALVEVNGHRALFELSGDQKAWKKKEEKLNLDAQQLNEDVWLNQDIRQLIFFLFPQLISQKWIVGPHP